MSAMNITKERWFRFGIGTIMVLVIIWLLNADRYVFTPAVIFIQTLFLPFLIAGVLFYLTRPLSQLLENWRFPRKVAILFIFLIIAGILALVINLLLPIVQAQFVRLIDNVPAMIDTIQDAIAYWQDNQESIPQFVIDAVHDIGDKLKVIFSTTGSFITDFLSRFVGFLFSLVVVPFILFYLLNDRDAFMPNFLRLFPKSREQEIRNVLEDMDRAIGGYIQGQLIVSTCVGFILLVGYYMIGLDYALLLALFGMVMDVIPFLGAFISVIPALIAAWFQDPIMMVYVAIVMIVAHLFESNLIAPQVMGRVLRIHPLTIILLILVGGKLAGILGMILIIPSYAVLKVITQHAYRLFTISRKQNMND